jgi:hypothetical protein
MTEIVETRTNRLWLEDGILYFEYFPGVEISMEDAIEISERQRQLIEGKRRPVLGDISQVRSISREARTYFASDDFQETNSALALLVNSPVSKVIGNMFIGFSKTIFPTRLFTSRSKALEWLQAFK